MASNDAPAPTPPKETSAAQTGTNVSTAIANSMMGNVNQVTPQGNLTYQQSGDYNWTDPYTGTAYNVPKFTATQTFSPQEQAKYDQTSAAEGNLAGLAAQQSAFLKDYMAQPMSISDLGAAPQLGQLKTGYDIPDTQQVQDALMARMQPSLDRDRSSLDTKLSNMGLKAGSDAWLEAMRSADQQTNDARLATIINAGQEQSRLAGLNQSQASFGNSALMDQYNAAMSGRTQQLQERQTLRNQPINEITALVSGSQVSQPNYVNAQVSKIPTTDNAGIISNYDNQKMQAWQLSDETTKKDKKKVGKLKGHTLYEYKYKDDPAGKKQIGVMAQEVEKKRPDAVKKGTDGKKRVNYGKLFAAGAK